MNSLKCLICLCSWIFLKHPCIPSFACSRTFSGSLLPSSDCVSYSFWFVSWILAGPGASLCPGHHMLPGCLSLFSAFSPNLYPLPFPIHRPCFCHPRCTSHSGSLQYKWSMQHHLIGTMAHCLVKSNFTGSPCPQLSWNLCSLLHICDPLPLTVLSTSHMPRYLWCQVTSGELLFLAASTKAFRQH